MQTYSYDLKKLDALTACRRKLQKLRGLIYRLEKMQDELEFSISEEIDKVDTTFLIQLERNFFPKFRFNTPYTLVLEYDSQNYKWSVSTDDLWYLTSTLLSSFKEELVLLKKKKLWDSEFNSTLIGAKIEICLTETNMTCELKELQFMETRVQEKTKTTTTTTMWVELTEELRQQFLSVLN